MKITFGLIVLIGLLMSGSGFILAFVTKSSYLLEYAVYTVVVGYFFYIIALVVGFIRLVLLVIRPNGDYWAELWPINLGLALSFTPFIFYNPEFLITKLLVVTVLAVAFAYTAKIYHLYSNRFFSISLLFILLFTLVPLLQVFWKEIIFFVGISFILITLSPRRVQ